MIRNLVLAGIAGYRRVVSPLLPAACRYLPTCSEYASEAIAKHGVVHGGVLAVRRLVRCAPWHPGGHDPVPEPTGTAPRR